MTYVHTQSDGWVYLTTILDLYSRKVIVQRLHIKATSQEVLKTLNIAFDSRQPSTELSIHSDLGVQFTSYSFEKVLSERKITHSYSRRATSYDNAVIEAYHANLKKELIHHQLFKTFERAQRAIQNYTNNFYNSSRLHSAINYLTPNEAEMNFFKAG